MNNLYRPFTLPVTALVLAVISNATLSAQSSIGSRVAAKRMAAKTVVGLDGYCPVCVVAARKWEKGNSQIRSTFDGFTYYFPNKSLKTKFEKSPEKFVPVLNGDCIVCFEKHGKRVPGKTNHAVMQDGRLYLFPSEKEKAAFLKAVNTYRNSDVAEDGNCIVCRVAAGKKVPGSAEHTVVHNGLRYLFPSAKEATIFQKDPAKFTKKKTNSTAASSETRGTIQVSVTGRSACAACEFGVNPLGATDELGLAIVGADKRVTVVEDAHKLYPNIYKNRFQGKQLVAMGTVVKKMGNITWIRPSSLKQTN